MQGLKQGRKRYQKDSAPADDIITLIHLVRQNPALYNYKLQPSQRRRIDILNGWSNIAAQIGNKYSVEECRRKWKNLRDTYHQYRLRKPKLGDGGLSKWRYAKELSFLSNVYQPKLKSHRQPQHQQPQFNVVNVATDSSQLLHDVQEIDDDPEDEDEHDDAKSGVIHGDMHHHSITLVNDDETFILTAYEECDNVDDPHNTSMTMDLTHDDVVEGDIVKHESTASPLTGGGGSGDDATGGDVDYEEVCMYEEAAGGGNGGSGGSAGTGGGNADCDTIIGSATRSASTDSKTFEYIDNEFCISSINATHTQLPSSGGSSVIGGVVGGGGCGSGSSSSNKMKHITLVNGANGTVAAVVSSSATAGISSGASSSLVTSGSGGGAISTFPTLPTIVQLSSINAPTGATPTPPSSSDVREELNLFFDFLAKKIQHFSKADITAIQVEFLNCVLRREAEKNPN